MAAEEVARRGKPLKTPMGKPSGTGGSRSTKRLGRTVALGAALNLLSGQDATRRSRETADQQFENQTQDAINTNFEREERRSSVLDAGAKRPSYVFTEPKVEPPIAGGGLMEEPTMQLERARVAEQRMRETRAQFIGEPEEGALPATGTETPAQPSEPTSQPAGAEEETPEEEETDIESGRLRDARAQEQLKQLSRAQAQQQAQLIQKQVRKKMLDSVKVGNGALSIETLAVTLFINLALWNIQGINKYLWKSNIIPTQSNAEDMMCTTCDFFLCFNGIFCSPPCFLGPTLLLIGTLSYFAKEYAEPIFKLFNIFT